MKKSRLVIIGSALFACVFAAAIGGTFVGYSLLNQPGNDDIPVVLKADSASSGKSLSMATGLVDRERGVEGLFVLDHLSGNIQCWVINPRNGNIAGLYRGNANQDLGLAKGGDHDYVMVVGQFAANNAARRGNKVPAGCICYVGDGNTGKVVGYSFFYDRQVIQRNGSQQANLEVIAQGLAREATLQRDN